MSNLFPPDNHFLKFSLNQVFDLNYQVNTRGPIINYQSFDFNFLLENYDWLMVAFK